MLTPIAVAAIAVTLCATLASADPDLRDLRRVSTATTVQLNVDPIAMWSPQLGNRGYSCEAALKAAGHYWGVYASQQDYRMAGSASSSTAIDLSTTALTAAAAFGLSTSVFSAGTTAVNSAFSTWVRKSIDANAPVLVGLYTRLPGTMANADYDTVGLIIGYSTASGLTFTVLDFVSNVTLTVGDSTLYAIRPDWLATQPPTPPYAYAIPVPNIVAVAITGIVDTGAGSRLSGRAMIHAPFFAEPLLSVKQESVTMYASIVSLSATSFYSVLEFTNRSLIPFVNVTGDSAGVNASYTIPAAQTASLIDMGTVMSNSLHALRVVSVTSPPATDPATYQQFANTTCAWNDIGIYSLDASAVSCPDVAQCRTDLCNCLGVGDSDRCWMRSFLPCRDFLACFAVATHCIELSATVSTVSACSALRQGYAAVAPMQTAGSLTSAKWNYQFSDLSKQCSAFVCNAAQLYYFKTGCTVDEGQQCDTPNLIHASLVLASGSSKESLGKYYVSDDLAAALAQDVTDVAMATISSTVVASVLQLIANPDDATQLTFHLRLDPTDVATTNLTLFMNAMNDASRTWPKTATRLRTLGASGTVTVISFTLLTSVLGSSLFDALKRCDNNCLLLATCLGILGLLICFVCCSLCHLYLCKGDDAEDEMSLNATVRKVKELQRAKAAQDEEELVEDEPEAEREPFPGEEASSKQRPTNA